MSIVRLLVKTSYQIKMTTDREPQQYGVLFEAHQIGGKHGFQSINVAIFKIRRKLRHIFLYFTIQEYFLK